MIRRWRQTRRRHFMSVALAFALTACATSTNPSTATPSSTNAPSVSEASASVGAFPLGTAVRINCGDSSTLFSVSGRYLACDDVIYSWPGLRPGPRIASGFAGWGSMDGTDYALSQNLQNGQILAPDGTTQAVPIEDAPGRITLQWSATGDSVWIASGIGTTTVTLSSWEAGSSVRRIGTITVESLTPTSVTASPNSRWLLAYSRTECTSGSPVANSGCVRFALVEGEGTKPVYERTAGSIMDAWVNDDGSHAFTTFTRSAVSVWYGRASQRAALIAEGIRVLPVDSTSIAIVDQGGVSIIDVRRGNRREVPADAVRDPSQTIGLSAGMRWIAAYDKSASTIVFTSLRGQSQSFAVPVDSATTPSVIWSPDERFALVFTGPPIGTAVVRLAD